MTDKISLAGDLGSGKSTVANILVERLGAEYYSTGSIVRGIAERMGMTIGELNVYMESHPESNVLITNHRKHNRDTGIITEEVAKIDRTIPLQNAMWGGSSFCNATIMYRADFMKAHLDLDEFIRRRLSLQDWPAWVILTAYTDIDELPNSTATFGIETISITRPDTVERLAKRYKGDKEVCRYLGELFPDKFPFSEREWDLYVNGRLMSKAFDLKQFELAKQYGKECVGVSKIKRLCSQNKLLFYLFIAMKHLRRSL